MPSIGVSLSGGGYRATAWALGVLLRLVDCGANRDVISLSSVSGGSIANGIVAQTIDFATADTAAVEKALRPGLRHIAHEGLFFFGRPTNRYVLAVLGVGSLAAALLVVLLVTLLLAAFGGPRRPDVTLALLGASLLALVTFVWLFSRRSLVVDRALARVHFHDSNGRPTLLKDIRRITHHVFCATELQSADHCYFTPRTVYSYRVGSGSPNDLPLSTAVQCSACLPGGFPPRVLATTRFRFRRFANIREPAEAPDKIVLTDGGVYDNMAEQWEYGYRERANRWPELSNVQPPASHLIVVNASAGWTWKGIRRIGALRAEVLGILRPSSVMYDVTTSRRRFELVERFTNAEILGEGLVGALVHIAQSPYAVPDRMIKDRDRARAARAAEAIRFLGDTAEHRHDWQERARSSSRVGTVLNALGETTTVDLLEHAYALAMVNLYVVLGIGRLEPVNRARLAALCAR